MMNNTMTEIGEGEKQTKIIEVNKERMKKNTEQSHRKRRQKGDKGGREVCKSQKGSKAKNEAPEASGT